MNWKQIQSDHRQSLKDIVALIEHEAFERGFREGRKMSVERSVKEFDRVLVTPPITHPDEGEWLLTVEPAGD